MNIDPAQLAIRRQNLQNIVIQCQRALQVLVQQLGRPNLSPQERAALTQKKQEQEQKLNQCQRQLLQIQNVVETMNRANMAQQAQPRPDGALPQRMAPGMGLQAAMGSALNRSADSAELAQLGMSNISQSSTNAGNPGGKMLPARKMPQTAQQVRSAVPPAKAMPVRGFGKSPAVRTPVASQTKSTEDSSGGLIGEFDEAGSAEEGPGKTVLSKRKLHELVAQVDPRERLDADVEEVRSSFLSTLCAASNSDIDSA